jgi:hypothetical protein
MSRRKTKSKNDKKTKYSILLVGVFAVLLLGVSTGFEFATFGVGENFSFDIDWSSVEVDDIKLLEGGLVTDKGTVSFDDNNQLINFDADGVVSYDTAMDRDSDEMPHATIAASFSDFGYVATVGGSDVSIPITKDTLITPYSTSESGGYIYDVYRIRFAIFIQTYSDVTNFENDIAYSPQVGATFSTKAIPSTASQEVLMSLNMKTNVGEGALNSSTFTIRDTYLVLVGNDADQWILKDTTAGYEQVLLASYGGEGEYSLDKPEMTAVDNIAVFNNLTGIPTTGHANVETSIDFDISSGAAYIDEEWVFRELYTGFDLEVDMVLIHNEFEDAKFWFLDWVIAILPKQLTVGYVFNNMLAFILILSLLIIVPLIVIWYYSKTYVRKISSTTP